MPLRDRLIAAWYAPRLTPLVLALLPLSGAFAVIVAVRRALYRAGLLPVVRAGVPVIVVGNLTVGGTGKTPLAMALAEALAVRGLHPGIVSRGYGGRHAQQGDKPMVVTGDHDPADVGDEPMLYAAAGFPVAIGRNRAAAAKTLLDAFAAVDVVISDDGLQHYALARDCEIVVVDAARGFGNGRMLPAGPLREPIARLGEVDLVVTTTRPGEAESPRRIPGYDGVLFEQRLVPSASLHLVRDPGVTMPVVQFAGKRVDAIAGIGDPGRFFATLRTLGMDVAAHPFPDHHAFKPRDIAVPGSAPIVMTAKDAVKCRRFADARCWYLPVRAQIDATLVDRVEMTIRGPQAP